MPDRHNRESDGTVDPSPQGEYQEHLIGLAALMRMVFAGEDLGIVGADLIERAERNPDDAYALMDLSTVLQFRGNRDVALAMQAQALEVGRLYRAPSAAASGGLRLLVLMGPGDLMANSPLEFMLEKSGVVLELLYVSEDYPLPEMVPDHDVLFIAIAESDWNIPLLKQVENATRDWPRPVLNRAEHIAWMSRDGACALLKSISDVIMPVTERVSRDNLELIGLGRLALVDVLEEGVFPIIVRPVDSHAGQGLAKLEDAAAVLDYLSTMPHGEFYLARFVDYRSADGLFRKYRIVLIEGRPFICHMAISEHWMIHYLNAGMADSAEKRAEEAAFMLSFDSDFARRHAVALRLINERAGLDYLGIDCGETADGKLLIFEIDSCMIVHAIDPVDLYPYKQPQMNKVFAAFVEMLENAKKRGA